MRSSASGNNSMNKYKNSKLAKILSSRISDLILRIKKLSIRKIKLRRPKIYKLRGYTTASRVNKKIRGEQTRRVLRNFLFAAVFVLIIAILLIIFNPLKDIKELFRMIGI